MDIKRKIKSLSEARGWTYYRLAKESGVSWSTIRNMFDRNTEPTVPTIEALCSGLGISLADLLLGGDIAELTSEQQELIEHWNGLTLENKQLILSLVKALNKA